MKMPDEKHIHIVSFNIPLPANYGGVIDVFYKIKALAEAGIKVHLHSYQYGRTRSRKLKEYCYKTYFYPRKHFWNSYHISRPYIVQSRRSPDLLKRLIDKPFPILFEGLHTGFYLDHPALAGRFKILRLHNVEWQYYHHLSQSGTSFIKRHYFEWESKRLKRYEKILQHASLLMPISPADYHYYSSHFDRVFYLPVFHANERVNIKAGTGEYALYHGNLSVAENEHAVLYLLRKVFQSLKLPIIIAGMNPSLRLQKACSHMDTVTLIANPSEERMKTLILNAQIHVLPTFQQTGIKLKLINTLYAGRHCIVNPAMVVDTGLEALCLIASDSEKMKQLIREFSFKAFGKTEIAIRRKVLDSLFSNKSNARQLIRQIKWNVR